MEAFQKVSIDPDGGVLLTVDGTVGKSDARSLFTPVIRGAQRKYDIPNGLLVGQTNHESVMDPGAVGYYIYYGSDLEYRGVDRGPSMINSKYNTQVTWLQAFDFAFAVDWSGQRLRSTFDRYRDRYPDRARAVLWDAAVCYHNSEVWGNDWARLGAAPNDQAAKYVNSVKAAAF